VVKRGYKAQRDGLGESCARCARLFFLSFFSGSFFFLFILLLFFFVFVLFPPARLLAAPNGSIVFDARQFNDATRPRLFTLARGDGGAVILFRATGRAGASRLTPEINTDTRRDAGLIPDSRGSRA